MWILNTICYLGEINRMTQFKNKSKSSKNINVGLLTYPILMASDILLYQADLVPVGADQKQHLELSRDLAQRFNHKYSETFKIPEPYIPEKGARIMSLQDVDKKMSKSDSNLNNIISLLDDEKLIRKKISAAVTDSEKNIKYSKDKKGISNLIDIFSSIAGLTPENIVDEYKGKMYSSFKSDLSDIIIDLLNPIQSEYNKIISDKGYLSNVLNEGSDYAQYTARKTLSKVYRKVGFIKK
jgi:tryptophanyl-tRNA synthetase